MAMKNPPHPGELIGDVLAELGISISAAAKSLGVTRQQIQRDGQKAEEGAARSGAHNRHEKHADGAKREHTKHEPRRVLEEVHGQGQGAHHQ